MNLRGFFMALVMAAATTALSSCFFVKPLTILPVKAPLVMDDSIPEEKLARVFFRTGFIPLSYNGIPVDGNSYFAIPAGKAEFAGNISTTRSDGIFTATGARFVFNFKTGGDYIVESVFNEDDELCVNIFEGTPADYYEAEHLARIML
jgi:hypothetical protein